MPGREPPLPLAYVLGSLALAGLAAWQLVAMALERAGVGSVRDVARERTRRRVIDDDRRSRRTEARAARATARREARETRRAASEAAYRASGVEPGPLAWYGALPGLGQALVLGLALCVPAGAMIAIVSLLLK